MSIVACKVCGTVIPPLGGRPEAPHYCKGFWLTCKEANTILAKTTELEIRRIAKEEFEKLMKTGDR